MEKFLEIGKIINTKGLDGTLKITPQTDDIKRFLNLKEVYIENEKYIVIKSYLNKNFAYIKLENVNLEKAECFKNKYIFVDRKNAVKLNKGEYFIADLLNLDVFLDDNTKLGKLTNIENYNSADIYTVENGKKEYTFCLVENLILSVTDTKIILNSKKLKEVLV